MSAQFYFGNHQTNQRCAVGLIELHCGDCFQLRVGQRWLSVRIELGQSGWYLIGLPPNCRSKLAEAWEGYEARFEEEVP